jgi:hypothetical protein
MITYHVLARKVIRHREDAAPYQNAAPPGRAPRPRGAESNTPWHSGWGILDGASWTG